MEDPAVIYVGECFAFVQEGRTESQPEEVTLRLGWEGSSDL